MPSRLATCVCLLRARASRCSSRAPRTPRPLTHRRRSPAPTKLQYPAAARGDVVDDYHDVKVADPYRWFEDPNAQATKDWVAAENAVSQPYLERLPQRAWLGNRLKQLWTYERFEVPKSEAGRYFYSAMTASRIRACCMSRTALNAPPRVLVDPNGKREDATIALSEWLPSPDGKVVAYALSDGGSDWDIWHFRRVDDGAELPAAQVQQVLARHLGARQLRRLLQPLSAEGRDRRRRCPARRRCRPARRVLPQTRRRAVSRQARLPGDGSSHARARAEGHRRRAISDHRFYSKATRPTACSSRICASRAPGRGR